MPLVHIKMKTYTIHNIKITFYYLQSINNSRIKQKSNGHFIYQNFTLRIKYDETMNNRNGGLRHLSYDNGA